MGVWLQGCGCACVCVWLCACVWDSVFVCSCISVYILPHTQFTHQEPQHSHGTWKGSTLFWTWKTVYLCVCMYGCVCVTVGDDSVYVTVWGWRCGCSCVCVCVWLYVWLCVDVAVGGLCMCMTVCDYVHLCWPHDCDCVWLCVIVCVCVFRGHPGLASEWGAETRSSSSSFLSSHLSAGCCSSETKAWQAQLLQLHSDSQLKSTLVAPTLLWKGLEHISFPLQRDRKLPPLLKHSAPEPSLCHSWSTDQKWPPKPQRLGSPWWKGTRGPPPSIRLEPCLSVLTSVLCVHPLHTKHTHQELRDSHGMWKRSALFWNCKFEETL